MITTSPWYDGSDVYVINQSRQPLEGLLLLLLLSSLFAALWVCYGSPLSTAHLSLSLLVCYMVSDTDSTARDDGSVAYSGPPGVPHSGHQGVMANSGPVGKAAGPPPALPSPSTSQLPVPQGEVVFRRSRSGGTGSFGAGANTRQNTAARNNQSTRKQHKPRRPRMQDEDADAERVSLTT